MSRTKPIWILCGVLCAAGSAHAQSGRDAKAPDAAKPAEAAAAQGPTPAAGAEPADEATGANTPASATGAAGVPATPPSASAGPQTRPAETDELSGEVDALMDRMVRARTRIAALGEALFKTRVELWIDNRVDDHRILRVRLYLDGAPVHDSDGKGLVRDERVQLHSGYAAPGMHDLRVEVSQASSDNADYEYTLAQSFRFRVPKDQRTEVRLRFDDDSDIAEDFEDDQDGQYDVRTRMRVIARPLDED